jgi:asparagine synthase (glutamine-hydrolysing)
MCGIFALIGNAESLDPQVVQTSFESGKKRGPEFSQLNRYNQHYIGFHRLAINGLTNGSQPFEIGDYVLVCNGEIYNYKELIADHNLKMTTESDCEVILHLYAIFGKDCIQKLDGEFAFILYDRVRDLFFVGRDQYGVRPLYINFSNGFCLCSDLEPMKCMDIQQVKQFTPGTYMFIEKGQENYYMTEQESYSKVLPTIMSDKKEYLYNIYALLCRAVVKRVENRERPIACLLSGGLDSSLVAAIAARHLREQGKLLETYSIGLEGSEDLKYAQIVADHIGSKHTQIVCTEDDFINSIPDVVRDIESYDTTSVRASVPNWNIGKYIKENSTAKVVLNGDGMDELCGGYLYFHKSPNSTEFDVECRRLLKDISYYDVLRSDKCISSHALEPRTPCLDKEFTEYYLRIPPSVRFHKGTHDKKEKYLIREAFETIAPELLPKIIINRKKETQSDGISSFTRPWYEIIQDRVKNMNIPEMNYEVNPPKTKEQHYYRNLYHQNYNCLTIFYMWMPKFVTATDPSARTMDVYKES